MRVAIISDVHANLVAREALREPYDALLCLGDLVDYGPHPQEAIWWVRGRASSVVRGNHDHALAYEVDCRCAAVMQEASRTTRAWHARLLTAEEKTYLQGLPLSAHVELGGVTFFLAYVSPGEDFHTSLRPDIAGRGVGRRHSWH